MSGFPVQRTLPLPKNFPPTLMVVVDTEEEFDWNAPFDPTSTAVSNIGQQYLAQDLFDAHGVRPTYVVDYPVASTQSSVAVLRRFLEDGRCEIGAHLHPWVTPPAGETVSTVNSYACNLPGELEGQKLAVLTDTIERNLGVRPRTYKAGRYGIGAGTPVVLRRLGYDTDVSVVPHTDFSEDGGPDFSGMPAGPFLAQDGLVGLPLSVDFVGVAAAAGPLLFPLLQRTPRRLRLHGVLARLGLLQRLRLSPEGHTLADMVRQTEAALQRGVRLLMLTYHSSSLLPGATSHARTVTERDRLVQCLADYLKYFFQLPRAATQTVRGVRADLLATAQP